MDRGFFDGLRPYSSRAQSNIEININSIHQNISCLMKALLSAACVGEELSTRVVHVALGRTSAYSWIATSIRFGWGTRLFSAFFSPQLRSSIDSQLLCLTVTISLSSSQGLISWFV